MKDYKKTLDRLLEILNRLYFGEILSVKELAVEFGVSERTIQRYLNEYLKDFPLKKVSNKYMLDNTKTDKDNEIVFEIMEKVLKENRFYSNNVFFTHLKIEDIGDSFGIIKDLKQAIKSKNYIEFFYKNSDFIIQPIKITNFEGYWYLLGFVENRYQFFYIKRIFNLKILNKKFSTHKIENIENAINAWYCPESEIEVEFLADEYVSKYLKRIPLNPTQTIINSYPDKTTLFSIKISHFMEIEKFIKSWIPRIVILKPLDLKEKIEKDLKEYLTKIGTKPIF